MLVQAKPLMSCGKSSQSDFCCRRTEYPSQAEELGDWEPGGIRPLVVKRQQESCQENNAPKGKGAGSGVQPCPRQGIFWLSRVPCALSPFVFRFSADPRPVLIKASGTNEARLTLTPQVKCKWVPGKARGGFCFCSLAAIASRRGRTLSSNAGVGSKPSPVFLFLKSQFQSRKKAVGKDVDCHAVFCGQVSISSHSGMQNWSLLL